MPERYYRVDIQFRNGTSEGFDAKEFDIDVSNTRLESGDRTPCGPPHQVLVLGAIWGGGTPSPRPSPSSRDSGGGALLGVAASKGRSSSTCEGVSSSLRLQYPQADEANLYLRRYPRDLVIGPLKALHYARRVCGRQLEYQGAAAGSSIRIGEDVEYIHLEIPDFACYLGQDSLPVRYPDFDPASGFGQPGERYQGPHHVNRASCVGRSRKPLAKVGSCNRRPSGAPGLYGVTVVGDARAAIGRW